MPLSRCTVLAVIVCLCSCLTARGQSFKKLADFTGANGANPYGPLLQGTDGNLYGTTKYGGTGNNCNQGCGTVFMMTRDGVLTTLHNFQGAPSDGAWPTSWLVLGQDEYLYGTTSSGGTNNKGMVFKIRMDGTMFKILHSFSGYPNDGDTPYGGLTLSFDDIYFYGTTAAGGSVNQGTVFKIHFVENIDYGIVYNFCWFDYPKCTDGSLPSGPLALAKDAAAFYGTTVYGGNSYGTVFRVFTNGVLDRLAQFDSTNGSRPWTGVTEVDDGQFHNFYGAAYQGGRHSAGTVFKITEAGKLTTLYDFCAKNGCDDGSNPYTQLVLGSDGSLYGTTDSGGVFNQGSIFTITTNGALTTLHSFLAEDGTQPSSGLIQADDGLFYGTTYNGGAYGSGQKGTVFRLDPGLALGLSVQKHGNGTVTSADTYINCGAVCSAGYKKGTQVTLTATPDPDWAFTRWAGCDTVQANVCTVTIDTTRNVTATFTATYQLSVSKTGSGTVTSSDGFINCGQTCSHDYLSFTPVTLTAAPAQGWALTGWTGCDQANGSTCSVTMSSVRNVSATFKVTYPLTVSNSGNGVVSSGDGHIYCGGACSFSYADGTQVKLTANPNAGYTLASWSGCNSAQDNVCTVVMSGAKNVIATFTQAQVSLTSLVLKPVSVKGGQVSVATLTLGQAAPSGGLGVGISSDHPQAVQPPSLVVVPGGKSSISFAVRTSAVRSKTVANVTATANSSHANATLTVNTNYGSSQKSANTPPAEDEQSTHPASRQQNTSASRQPLPQ